MALCAHYFVTLIPMPLFLLIACFLVFVFVDVTQCVV